MNSRDEVKYRLKLAQGFLKEAEEDFELKRWRSCVDNAQLAVENAGKAILSLFGVSPKTHEPAKYLARLIQSNTISQEIQEKIKDILPDFITLGVEDHFMTDYGDEATYTLPWDIFTQDSAQAALSSARLCTSKSKEIIEDIEQSRSNLK